MENIGELELTSIHLLKTAEILKSMENYFHPGEYSIFSIPGENEWEVFFNTNINYFGANRPDSSDDIVSVKVPVINLLNEVEQLTIDFERDSIFNYISIKWDLSKIIIPFR